MRGIPSLLYEVATLSRAFGEDVATQRRCPDVSDLAQRLSHTSSVMFVSVPACVLPLGPFGLVRTEPSWACFYMHKEFFWHCFMNKSPSTHSLDLKIVLCEACEALSSPTGRRCRLKCLKWDVTGSGFNRRLHEMQKRPGAGEASERPFKTHWSRGRAVASPLTVSSRRAHPKVGFT